MHTQLSLLALGAHAHEGYSTNFVCLCVCVCVCSKFAALKSSLYAKMDLPACFSPVFFDFQLIDLSKVPLFPRKSAFHGYFVVSNPHKRLCILLMILVVTWSTFTLYRACPNAGYSAMGPAFLDDRWHLAFWPRLKTGNLS